MQAKPTTDSKDGGNCAQALLEQAVIVDWFAKLLIAPPEHRFIEECRSAEMQGALAGLGETIGAQPLAHAIAGSLQQGSAEDFERETGREYVTLFDGMSGPCSVPPYESCHRGSGNRMFQQPYLEMQAILTDLDVSVAALCKEPADHIALELAALAEALRQQNSKQAADMLKRLLGWLPSLSSAVRRVAEAGFYAKILDFLIIFLSSPDFSGSHEQKTTYH